MQKQAIIAQADAQAPAQKPARKRINARKWRNFQELLCCLPAVFFIILLNHYALVETFRWSLTDWNGIRKSYNYTGFTNWKWLITTWETNEVLLSFKVTLIYTVLHLAMVIGIGLLFALLFNRMNKAFSTMRTIIFMPHYIAMSSVAIIFTWMYNTNFGVLNYFLECLGMDPVNWLTTEKYALWSILIMTFWKGVGYDMLIYLSAMQGISKDYYEAARIDGASSFSLFRKITLPLLGPTTSYLMVTQFLGSMKVFNAVDIMTGGEYGTKVVVELLYKMYFPNGTSSKVPTYGRAAVVSVVFFFVLLLITVVTMKWSEKKTNYDA